MRRLNGTLLLFAMNHRSWNHEDLAVHLKAKGLNVDPRIILKWCKGKLQPSADKIDLIEQTLGFVVSDDPKPRRVYGKPNESTQIAIA